LARKKVRRSKILKKTDRGRGSFLYLGSESRGKKNFAKHPSWGGHAAKTLEKPRGGEFKKTVFQALFPLESRGTVTGDGWVKRFKVRNVKKGQGAQSLHGKSYSWGAG